MASKKAVIVTGASQDIGAAVVEAFLDRGYNVVATSRSVSKAGFAPSPFYGSRKRRTLGDPNYRRERIRGRAASLMQPRIRPTRRARG
jgi:NAD(P)-dependent dehydrogenase (short-subunit alcohol dehydrogenase family)